MERWNTVTVKIEFLDKNAKYDELYLFFDYFE